MESLASLLAGVSIHHGGLKITLRKEQDEILLLVLHDKKDVITMLPTGFGKSLLYILPPLLLDEVCAYYCLNKIENIDSDL